MSRFGINDLDRRLRGDGDRDALEAGPVDRAATLQWLGLGGLVAVTAVLACFALAARSLREAVMLAVAAILALTSVCC